MVRAKAGSYTVCCVGLPRPPPTARKMLPGPTWVPVPADGYYRLLLGTGTGGIPIELYSGIGAPICIMQSIGAQEDPKYWR